MGGLNGVGPGGPSPDAVAGALTRALGLGTEATLTGPVDRGELGEVWRLETGQGAYAVKVPLEPVDPPELHEPAAFADAVADGGVATPRVLRGSDGSVVHTVAGQQVVVMQWLDLLPASTALEPEQVGRLLARVHRVPFTGARQPHWWYSHPVGADRWRELVALGRAQGAPFAEPLADHVGELVALEALLDPLPPDRTCHRDLWSDNVRALGGGGLGVVDWDNCGPCSQSEELAQVLFEFGRDEPARHRAIRDAYEDAGGPGRVRGRRAFSMLIAQLGNLGVYQIRQWLTAPPASSQRERAARAVDEFLGLPPHPAFNRASIEAILDALA